MFTVKAVGHGHDAFTVCLSAHAVDVKKRGDSSEGPSFDVILRDASNEIVEVLDVSPDHKAPRPAASRDRPAEFRCVYVMNEHGRTVETVRTWETREELRTSDAVASRQMAVGRVASDLAGCERAA
jgi:hypothetical protein